MDKESSETKEWGISTIILKAYLIEEVEDGCREAEVTINGNINYYDEDNLEELLGLIDKLDIKKIHINEHRETNVILSDDSIVYIEF